MTLAELEQRFPVGSLWKHHTARFVRRVVGHDDFDECVILDKDERYPDPRPYNFSTTPYSLHLDVFGRNLIRLWAPDELRDAGMELLNLDEELQQI